MTCPSFNTISKSSSSLRCTWKITSLSHVALTGSFPTSWCWLYLVLRHFWNQELGRKRRRFTRDYSQQERIKKSGITFPFQVCRPLERILYLDLPSCSLNSLPEPRLTRTYAQSHASKVPETSKVLPIPLNRPKYYFSPFSEYLGAFRDSRCVLDRTPILLWTLAFAGRPRLMI